MKVSTRQTREEERKELFMYMRQRPPTSEEMLGVSFDNCTECSSDVEVLVEFEDHDHNVVSICGSCLTKALKLIEKEEVQCKQLH